MSCEYCYTTDALDDAQAELADCETRADELEAELEETKADLHFAAEKCLIPLAESFGATRAEVLMAMGSSDPVSALRKLIKA